MGSIHVEFLSLFCMLTGVRSTTIVIDQFQKITLQELLEFMSDQYGELASYLGELSKPTFFNDKVTVLINGKLAANITTLISSGDRLIFLVPMCGG